MSSIENCKTGQTSIWRPVSIEKEEYVESCLLLQSNRQLPNRGVCRSIQSCKRLCMLWHVLLLLCVVPAYAEMSSTRVSTVTMQSLYSLYNSTQGASWRWSNVSDVDMGLAWNFTKNGDGQFAVGACDNWQGICCASDFVVPSIKCDPFANLVKISSNFTVGKSEDYVLVIYLEAMELKGSLPEQLFDISNIQILSINLNGKLSGSISNNISNLINITYISLSFNGFDGTLPSFVGLSALWFLGLDNNNLQGTIPDFTGLTSLEYLGLDNNILDGTIPTLTGLSSMHYMYLNNNSIYGTVPPLNELSSLVSLDLGDNDIDGTIPTLSGLSSLKYLVMDNNNICGVISSLVGLSSLVSLYLNNNIMEGTIPALLQLSSLKYLYLNNNYFVGTIPDLIGLSSLIYLGLNDNNLVGKIPALTGLSSLKYLYLNNNNIGGTIPVVTALSSLMELNAQDNDLSGTLPKELIFLANLSSLLLHYNHLTGSLVNFLPSSLKTIDFSFNSFSGRVPVEVFAFPSIQHVSMVQNCFSGSLNENICDANHTLESLALDGLTSGELCRDSLLWGITGTYTVQKFIQGTIPPCLFGMSRLRSLGLSGNGLTGTLPNDNFSISSSLRNLSMSYNQLSSTISRAFQDVTVNILDLSFNKLSGTLGELSEFYFDYNIAHEKLHTSMKLQYNKSLSLQVNRLSGVIASQFHNVMNISVVNGNLFDCASQSELPENDPGTPHTQCGSFDVNAGLGLWLALLVFGAVTMVVLELSGTHFLTSIARELVISLRSNEINLIWMNHMLILYLTYSCAALLIVLPLQLVMKSVYSRRYSTHTFQYAYTDSLAFLVSDVVAGIVLALITSTMTILWFMIQYCRIEFEHNKDEKIISSSWKKVVMWVMVVLTDAVVMITVNSCYIMIALYYSQTYTDLAVVALVIFKLVWNARMIPFAVKQVEARVNHSSAVSGMMMTGLVLFNNVLVPVIVTMCTQPLCFYNMFVAADDITANVEYYTVISNSFLTFQTPRIETLSYQPPFIYSYQCSSSLITYYVPMYVIMYIYQGFVSPVLSVMVTRLNDQAHTSHCTMMILNLLGCDLMKSKAYHIDYHAKNAAIAQQCDIESRNNNYDSNRKLLMNMQGIAAVLICNLTTMLTFGFAFPLLSVLICFAGCVEIVQWRVFMLRYLSFCRDEAIAADKRAAMISRLQTSCVGVSDILHQSRWLLLLSMSLFFSIFLLDMAGDRARGDWRKIVWAPVTVLLWPLMVVMCEAVKSRLCHSFRTRDSGSSEGGVSLRISNIDIINGNNNFNNNINNNKQQQQRNHKEHKQEMAEKRNYQ